jgi:hypothetical protein
MYASYRRTTIQALLERAQELFQPLSKDMVTREFLYHQRTRGSRAKVVHSSKTDTLWLLAGERMRE